MDLLHLLPLLSGVHLTSSPSAMTPPVMPPWKDEDEDPPRPEDLEGAAVHARSCTPPLALHVMQVWCLLR